ncbi:ATP-binding protein [Haloferax sp. DFSO52]|uniref:ATP-binding protein n=1 Tax=Haloferax sp. DFSO52 TaxID=3388505 RepID=UPI003A8A84C8
MSRDDEFVRETRGSVRQLTNGLVELERHGTSREHVDELFRTAHTLKGNCSMAGLDSASRLAHEVEEFLSSLRDGSVRPNPDLIDAALAAVDDIDALIQAWHDESDATTDPESSMATLRAEMDRYRDESGTGSGLQSASGDGSASASDVLDDSTDELDQTVVDALDSASGFDDLEGLLAEMDDPADGDDEPDEQARWGTFDNRDSSTPSGDADVDQRDASDESDGGRESGKIESSGAMNEFDAIKSDVHRDDVSSLDHELAEIEFGEFDHDDDLSIQDLIDGEVADADLSDEAVEEVEEVEEGDTVADDHPERSPATADTTTADDAIRPEDFGYESAVPSTPDDTASADEHGSSGVDEVTASGAAEPDDSVPFEGIDIVDSDDESGADYVSSVAADSTADDVSVTADTDEDEVPDISFPDGESFDPVGDEYESERVDDSTDEPAAETPSTETPTADSPSETATAETPTADSSPETTTEETSTPDSPPETATAEAPDFAETFEDDDGGPVDGFEEGDDFPDEFGDDDIADEFDADEIDFPTEDAEADLSTDLPGDDIDLSDDEFDDEFAAESVDADAESVDADAESVDADAESVDETPDEDVSETIPEAFDDGLDLPQDFLSGSLDVGSAADAAASADESDLATEDDIDDTDLPDIDLPDVDDLSGISLSDDDTGGVSFERDEHTMAFESRFAERFGGSVGDDKIQLVQMASATIEESRLDAARYQSSGTEEYPLDFGETRESDRIQSLTVDVENADSLLNLVEELSLTQLRIKQSDDGDIDDHLSVMDSVTGELRRAVMSLRLMPLSTAIDGLPRVVRDIARKQDKEVAFEVSDEGVNLDRSIVEKLGDPLVHLVRNAVDHGIEPPEERQKQGKPPEGTIELRAWRDRERVVIEVEDDGRGISAERIRQQAIDYDIISRTRAEQMSFDEVYDLVFEPGFSTAEEVTDVSGRGVGMDAVRRTVNSLDGTVELDSEPGSGTTVRLRLPVSVAVSKMLFVGVGHEQYAIPASAVADIELIDDSDLDSDGTVAVDRTEAVDDSPDRVQYRRLSEALGVDTASESATVDKSGDTPTGDSEWTLSGGTADEHDAGGIPAGKRVLVRLDPDTHDFALVCDEVDDAREVVVKPYEKLLGGVPGISGATMSGDGTLVNIIDVTTL